MKLSPVGDDERSRNPKMDYDSERKMGCRYIASSEVRHVGNVIRLLEPVEFTWLCNLEMHLLGLRSGAAWTCGDKQHHQDLDTREADTILYKDSTPFF